MNLRRLALVGAVFAASITAALGAGVFQGYPTITAPTGSESIPVDTNLAQGINPATGLISTSVLGNFSGTPRNYLDNGSFNIQQRGTGTVTCAANAAITSAAYGPDRWGCSANVGSGAGRSAIVTTAALLPAGFAQVNTIFRTSGALTQPICSIQEIPTAESTALAGKTVTLSFFAAALAGLAADNGNLITASIFTGTGSDQGLGTMTASPAITPAWTGIAFSVNQQVIPITTTPTRYQVTGAIPAAATEVGVAICFTPTATGAGATDGFAFVGAQLEVATSASPYEFHTVQQDLAKAQRYFYRLTETAAVTPIAPCSAVDTTHTNCLIQFPVPMRTVPTMTYANGFASPTSTTQATLGACTTLASAATVASTAPNSLNVLVNCTATTIPAAGVASFLYSNGGTGVITASADF